MEKQCASFKAAMELKMFFEDESGSCVFWWWNLEAFSVEMMKEICWSRENQIKRFRVIE